MTLTSMRMMSSSSSSSSRIRRVIVIISSNNSSSREQHRRSYHDYLRIRISATASARISLAPNSVYGIATSRGERSYQEDAHAVACLTIPHPQLQASYHRPPAAVQKDSKTATEWEQQLQSTSPDIQALSNQLIWFACYDGHGGQAVSDFLKNNLHRIFESVDPSLVTDTVQHTRALGGYFRRFSGGELARWVRQERLKPIRAVPASALAPGRSTGTPPNRRSPGVMSAAELQRDEELQDAKLREDESKKEAPPKTLADLIDDGAGSSSSAGPDAKAEGQEASIELEPESQHQQQKKPHRRRKGEPVPFDEVEDFPALTEKIDPPDEVASDTLTLAERATLSWLVADRMIQANDDLNVGGSTASVALLHSLDVPAVPFYSSKLVGMTVAHVGDTRLLLCAKSNGEAIPLTNYHHPDSPAESERLRKVGAGMVTDSFGEARWMGALANTRAFGDSRYKRAGVTAEPEVLTRIINGDDFAFIIGFSDGIGGVMSDQEIVDLCREARHPSDAAKAVLRFAEELGSEDNCTVLCVPLRGWGQVGGKDTTKERRELRRSKTDIFRDHRQ
ncbi:hypothetical protein V8E36_004962 [Tilletia maclaganii]